MSIEYYAAVDKDRLPDGQGLNAAATAMDVPLQASPSFSGWSARGFQPFRLNGHKSGTELSVSPFEAHRGDYDVFDDAVAGKRDSVVTLRWGANALEGAVSMGLCAILERAAGALVYSTEEDRFVGESELLAAMNELASFAEQSGAAR
jgi:hypothetical protein